MYGADTGVQADPLMDTCFKARVTEQTFCEWQSLAVLCGARQEHGSLHSQRCQLGLLCLLCVRPTSPC